MKLRSARQVEKEWAYGEAGYEMGGGVKFLWALARFLGVIVAPIVAVIGVVYLFTWAGTSIMVSLLGTAPVWAACLLVLGCSVVYPFLRGGK